MCHKTLHFCQVFLTYLAVVSFVGEPPGEAVFTI